MQAMAGVGADRVIDVLSKLGVQHDSLPKATLVPALLGVGLDEETVRQLFFDVGAAEGEVVPYRALVDRVWVRISSSERLSGADALELAGSMKGAAAAGEALDTAELASAVLALRRLGGGLAEDVDWASLRRVLAASAHRSHKDWATTIAAASDLAGVLPGPDDPAFRRIFERVLVGGGWDAAVAAAEARDADHRPWVVLVTGLNGIRKTTCIYQTWFRKMLSQALAVQRDSSAEPPLAESELPDGGNTFFRQLDFIVATVAGEDFRKLYTVEDVGPYAALKDAIFARQRTVAEMWGVLLVREAQKRRANVMVETSGRDAGMFTYVDQLFPDDSYRKMVLRFEINDIGFAEASVDTRMLGEMRDGQAALRQSAAARELVSVNAGGPYGSKALAGVQADSDARWQEVLRGELAQSWHRAVFSITARADGDWTAQAKGADEAFVFRKLQDARL